MSEAEDRLDLLLKWKDAVASSTTELGFEEWLDTDDGLDAQAPDPDSDVLDEDNFGGNDDHIDALKERVEELRGRVMELSAKSGVQLGALRGLVGWVDATGIVKQPAFAGMVTGPLDYARKVAG